MSCAELPNTKMSLFALISTSIDKTYNDKTNMIGVTIFDVDLTTCFIDRMIPDWFLPYDYDFSFGLEDTISLLIVAGDGTKTKPLGRG